ncbi:recombinase family protein [Aquibium microcysteis]|uniref:recombinase family protein n=1 Tax=Aquibium microcysteis TaxID=675281 RepID=UPI00165D23A7|nr:recombinase family protein [Aquibium microcysteis]
MRVATYTRVSTGRQAAHDLSLPAQTRCLEEYVAVRRGWTIVDEYVERGKTAKNDKRPELQRMMSDARAGAFDIVLVYSTSRFFRELGLFETYATELNRLGITLVSATQNIDDGDGGILNRQILAAVDAHSSRDNAKNVKRVMTENAKKGFWNGSTPPLGYTTKIVDHLHGKDKKKLAIDPVEEKIVKKIFDLYLNGDGSSGPLGCKALVVWLNQHGYRTRRGKLWHVGPLYVILTNTAYIGYYCFGSRDSTTRKKRPPQEVVRVECPAIIPEATFQKVQSRLKSKNPKTENPRVVSGPILLTGLARCAKCNGMMTIRTGKGGRYRYYTCAGAQSRGKEACEGLSIPMDKLDDASVSAVLEKVLVPERVAALLTDLESRHHDRQGALKSEAIRVEAELSEKRAGLSRLYDAIEQGVMKLDGMLKERIERSQTEVAIAEEAVRRSRRKLTDRPGISPEMIVQFSDMFRQRVTKGAVTLRKAYLRSVVDRIVVSEDAIRIVGPTSRLRDEVLATGQQSVPSSVHDWRTRQDSNL